MMQQGSFWVRNSLRIVIDTEIDAYETTLLQFQIRYKSEIDFSLCCLEFFPFFRDIVMLSILIMVTTA